MDPVDELMIIEAQAVHQPAGRTARVAVLDAPGCAAAATELGAVTAYCDSWLAESGLRAQQLDGVEITDDPTRAVTGADLVLLGLPPGAAALEEWSQLVAAHADPEVRLVAGARIKHLRPVSTEVLSRSFVRVRGSLGRRKARVLHAEGAREPGRPSAYPRRRSVDLALPSGVRPIELVAHGAGFAQGRVDAGTRLLIGTAASWPTATDALDLGCGDGVLAVVLALTQPDARVAATDDSAAAYRSTIATAAANGVTVEVRRADGLTATADRSTDLIVCNPPFHRGAAKDSTPARTMLADAGRVLRPGGELWTVFNSHLPYLPWLRSSVGPTTIRARDRSYTVTRSVAR